MAIERTRHDQPNIGAGLLVLFAGPILIALVFFAVAMAFAR